MTPVPSLTVMTQNLGAGLADPARLVAAVRASGADIIGLQELALAPATELVRDVAVDYPFRLMHPLDIPGKGLLSRFPLRDAVLQETFPGRPDLFAVVETPNGPVTVVVAHPPPPRLGRRWAENRVAAEQLARVAEVATAGGPAIVLVDLNRIAWQAAYRDLIGAGLIDAFASAGAGPGATHPTRLVLGRRRLVLPPFLRIDTVWHTAHFRTLAAWTGDDAGSDHRPVLARLARVAPPEVGGAGDR